MNVNTGHNPWHTADHRLYMSNGGTEYLHPHAWIAVSMGRTPYGNMSIRTLVRRVDRASSP